MRSIEDFTLRVQAGAWGTVWKAAEGRQLPNNMWVVEKIEISGGFLPGLSITIPQGLTCIIGARGSGKSTLAEALRFALCGTSAAPKHCVDLIQANLAGGALVTVTALADGLNRYTVKRGLKQNPVLLTSDGRAINTVDLLVQRNLYVQSLQNFIQAKYNAILNTKIYEFYMGQPIAL